MNYIYPPPLVNIVSERPPYRLLFSYYKSSDFAAFKAEKSSFQTTLQMFTGVYRVSAEKSECWDFKFMGIACIPAIPVIFDVNTLCGLLISTLYYDFSFKFPYNFCGDFRIPAIPVKFICILQGTLCDTGIPHTF